jgi:delta-aminolevulinic acid dehydratase/porphobilinogen synthase
MNNFPQRRLRRLRGSPTLRRMLGGVRRCRDELIAPRFVCPGSGVAREIAALPVFHG